MKSSSSSSSPSSHNNNNDNKHNNKTIKEYGLDPQIYSSPSYTSSTNIKQKQQVTKSHSNNNNKRSESITFRLDSIILNKLRNEANQKDVSINTLVSQIIKQHIDWHSNAAKAGFISVRRELIVKLMEKVSEQDISSIVEYIAKTSNKDFIMMLRNQYNIESALDLIETWIRISGYPYRHEVDNINTNNNNSYTTTVHSYIIQHDMGRKWSLYLSELYRCSFEEFGLGKVYFDISDNMLSFVVDTERMV